MGARDRGLCPWPRAAWWAGRCSSRRAAVPAAPIAVPRDRLLVDARQRRPGRPYRGGCAGAGRADPTPEQVIGEGSTAAPRKAGPGTISQRRATQPADRDGPPGCCAAPPRHGRFGSPMSRSRWWTDRRTPPTQRGPPGAAQSPGLPINPAAAAGYDNDPDPTGGRGEAIVRTDAQQVGQRRRLRILRGVGNCPVVKRRPGRTGVLTRWTSSP